RTGDRARAPVTPPAEPAASPAGPQGPLWVVAGPVERPEVQPGGVRATEDGLRRMVWPARPPPTTVPTWRAASPRPSSRTRCWKRRRRRQLARYVVLATPSCVRQNVCSGLAGQPVGDGSPEV